MNDEIFAELIVDSKGIHVDPYMLRLVLKIKGKDRIVLISDACVFDGPPIPGLEDATDLNFDFNGDIAGSKLTLDVACRNMMVHTGAGICDVFRYASKNPATLLGRTDLGEVREGAVADLIIVDHWMNVLHVIQEGNRII
ncbi:N-acetylglucosamine-6-phosphate deacetylase [bioreactor metagenome]|uniref:N-acetylglucosamine-6-phosphate deacetylase n=1 Tax=bioreactor metagenome TaxID=1076179 RepID=A0A645D970_9ZZZZ